MEDIYEVRLNKVNKTTPESKENDDVEIEQVKKMTNLREEVLI
jgi:hypothetical protein